MSFKTKVIDLLEKEIKEASLVLEQSEDYDVERECCHAISSYEHILKLVKELEE